MPSFRPPLHPRSTLPPPRRVGLRFPTPVGHGRGLASRPGCAGPGEGVGSPPLRPASPTPGKTPQVSCRLPGSQALLACARDSLCLPPVLPFRLRRGYYRPTLLPCPSASTGPTAFLAEPDHASFFAGNCHCQGKQPPPVRRPVSVAAGGNPPGKRFLPIHWPIRQ